MKTFSFFFQRPRSLQHFAASSQRPKPCQRKQREPNQTELAHRLGFRVHLPDLPRGEDDADAPHDNQHESGRSQKELTRTQPTVTSQERAQTRRS